MECLVCGGWSRVIGFFALMAMFMVAMPQQADAANGSCAGSGCVTSANQGGALGPCFCDNNCWLRGDCCPDVCDECRITHTNDVCNQNSATNGCGPSAYIETGVAQNRIPPCGTPATINVGPGTRTSFNVVVGAQYNFNTCSSSWDTEITGYTASGGNYTQRFYNENGCGQQSTVTWTATFTGTVNVTVHQDQCNAWGSTGGTSAVLAYNQLNNLNFTSTQPTNLCTGQNYSLAATPTGGSFSVSGAGASISGTTFSSTSAGNFTVTYTLGQCSTTQVVNVKANSGPTTNITENPGSTICAGDNVTLTRSGGSLGTGATWQWYTGPNGTGTNVGNGNSITVSPATTTTYYVRAEGDCGNTADFSQQIIVQSQSTAPAAVNATADTICNGLSTQLSITGGSAGTGATLQWYTGPNGTGTNVGSGTPITVSPTSTTTYYARYEGTCNTTADASLEIIVETLSTDPTTITSTNGTLFCTGSANTTLSVSGGSLGTGATWQWYSGSCGGTFVGSGPSIGVNPTATTTYFVRAEGDCNQTSCASLQIDVSTGLTVSGVNTTSVTCNGFADGAVGLTGQVSGGIGPYSYQWNPGGATSDSVTGLSAGTYTVTVTDAAGCTASTSGMVMQPTAITITNVASSSIDCNGAATGTIDIFASGGTGNLFYSIDSGFTFQATSSYTGLTAGNYNVFVQDDNGCLVTYSSNPVVLTQPTPLDATVAATQDAACAGVNNGSLTVTATGGTLPYGYSLNGGSFQPGGTFSALPAGNYEVIVRDNNNCEDTVTATISNATVLLLAVDTIVDIDCNGDGDGSFTVSASNGTGPYEYSINGITYQPSGTFSNLNGGSYIVQARDAVGCTANTTVNVNEPDPLVVTVDSVINIQCNGDTTGAIYVTVTGGTQGTFSGGGAPVNQFVPFPSNTVSATSYSDPSWVTLSGGTLTGRPFASGGCCSSSNTSGLTDIVEFTVDVTGSYTITSSWTGFDGYLFLYGDPLGFGPSSSFIAGDDDFNGTSQSQIVGVSLTAGVTYYLIHSSFFNATGPYSTTFTGPGNAGTNQLVPGPGGTTAYQFAWSNGFDGEDLELVGAGTYTLTVTDTNGCVAFASATITEPLPLTVTLADSSQVSCNGGSDGELDISVTGGVPPYTFDWSDGTTTEDNIGLTAGTYGVTVTDANGCENTQSFTINEPDALAATATLTDPTCAGAPDGEIDLEVTDGTPPYTYLWNTNATTQDLTGLAAGTYTVQIRDANNCLLVESYTLATSSLLAITADSIGSVLCAGDTTGFIDVTVSGGIPGGSGCPASEFELVLTLDNFPSETGYSLTDVTNGGVLLSVPGGTYAGLPPLTVITETVCLPAGTDFEFEITDAFSDGICCGFGNGSYEVIVDGATVFTGGNFGASEVTAFSTPAVGASPYTFAWSNGDTTEDLTNVAAGTYTLTATAPSGCTVTETFTISEPAPLDLTETITQVSCFGDSTGSISVVASGGNTSGGLVPDSATITVTINFDDFSNEISWELVDDNTSVVYGQVASYPSNETQDIVDVKVPSGASVTFTIFDSFGDGLSGFFGPPGNYNVTSGGNTFASGSGNFANAGFDESTSFTAPTVLVPGPSGGYQFVWSTGDTTNSINSLPVGTYSVTVSDDNACEYTETYTITQPDSIEIQATVTDVDCNGRSNGAIATTVSGGVAPYTYAWSGGQTTATVNNLAAGTYTLTVTDANGCEAIDSFAVAEPTAITVVMSGTDASCNGGSDGSATATVTGGTAPYSYFWNVSQTTATANGLSAGTYTVLITDANGCTANGSYTVGEPTPIVATDSITNVSCFGAADGEITVNLSGGTPPFDVTWSNGPTATATTTTTNSGLTAGNYTLSATDANGCPFTASYTVTEPDSITLTGTATDADCFGAATGSVDLTVTGGTMPYTYSWSPGSAATQDLTGVAADTYTVVVTDANGCTATWSATVGEPDSLDIQASVDSVSCNGGNDGAIFLSVTGGTPGYTYTWNDGATTANRTGLTAGAYTVTVEDANGCQTIPTFTVGEPDAITTGIVSNDVDCFGAATGDIDLTVTGGTAPYTFLWSNFATTEDIGGLTAGLYTVIVTDANGCQTTDTVTISQNPELEIAGTTTNITCFGFNDGTATVVVTGGVSPYTYSWSNGDVTDTADSLAPGQVSVTVTDDVGCTATESYIITQPDSLELTGVVTNVTCASDSNGAIDVTVVGGTTPYTYLWSNGATSQDLSGLAGGTYILTTTDDNGCVSVDSFEVTEPDSLLTTTSGTGITCFGFANGSAGVVVTGGTPPYTYFWSNFRFTQNIYNLEPGEYFVIVEDANGCTTVDSVEVFEPALLEITGSVKESGCFGEEKGIVDITVTGGTVPYDYIWSTGDTTEDLFNLAAGQYIVTVTDANGCVDSFSAVVTSLPQPDAGFTANTACAGQEVQFLNNSTIPNGSIDTYEWIFGNNLGFSADENPVFTFDSSGNQNVTLIITSDRGCKDTVVQTIFINPVPNSNIFALGDTLDVCTADSVTLEVAEGTDLIYIWSNGDSTFNTTVTTSGVYYVTVVNAVGCATSDSIDIGIYSSASVTASPSDTTVSLGFSAQLTATGGISYEWEPAASLDDPTSATPLATPLENTTYSVTVTVSPGCTGVREVTVNVIEDFLVIPPNLFSPNGDGINDTWLITNIVTYPSCEVFVFNRWGGEIFSTTDYQNDWDGTNSSGDPLSDGTYYYILKCGDQTYKGDITILR